MMEAKDMSNYVTFEFKGDHYIVKSSSDVKLGEIYYNRSSRFYLFHPVEDSSFGSKSLKEISSFLVKQNESKKSYQ